MDHGSTAVWLFVITIALMALGRIVIKPMLVEKYPVAALKYPNIANAIGEPDGIPMGSSIILVCLTGYILLGTGLAGVYHTVMWWLY